MQEEIIQNEERENRKNRDFDKDDRCPVVELHSVSVFLEALPAGELTPRRIQALRSAIVRIENAIEGNRTLQQAS